MTTTTLTGSRQVQEALGDRVQHVYAPYDLPDAVARFLRKTRPRIAIIMETKLWPNVLRRCARAGIPVLIANARLSERSAQGYARIGRLMMNILQDITLIAAPAEADAKAVSDPGCATGRGHRYLKYDLKLPDELMEQGRTVRREWLGENRRVWIAASTHAGEDEQILEALTQLRTRWPTCCSSSCRATEALCERGYAVPAAGFSASSGAATGNPVVWKPPFFSAIAWANCYCSTPPQI